MGLATREAYGKTLANLINENEKIIVLDADLTKSTKTIDAKNACPQRHFNMGIAEGNMMSVASGFAATGFTVFASTFAIFAAGRAWEQIRNSICYPNLNVKICGTHAGISVGEDGASHQALEDIAIMRSIPNMTVYQPCDEQETNAIIRHVASQSGPAYVRLGRAKVEDVYPLDYVFEIGKANIIKKGRKVALFCTGAMVQEAIKAARILEVKEIFPTIINISCIKPIDIEGIIEVAKNHDILVSAEEHNVIGGLGSAISDVLIDKYPKKLTKIGINDTFGESGPADQLMEKYALTAHHIADCIESLLV